MLKPIHLFACLMAISTMKAQAEDSVIKVATEENNVAAIDADVPAIPENYRERTPRNYSYSSNNSYSYSATASYTIYTMDFLTKIESLRTYLAKHKIKSGNINQSQYSFSSNFEIENSQLDSFNLFIRKVGYITQSSYNTQNLDESIRDHERNIENYTQQIKNYETRIAKLDESKSESRESLLNQLNNYKRYVSDYQNKIAMIERNRNYTAVTIEIYDENSTPDGRNSRISWVRMPGLSYHLLTLENPKLGLSAQTYQGASLRYLFTKGKSFFEIGVLKAGNAGIPANATEKDSQMYNEFFMLSFGQDFYTRHFGRGNRKWFNLYSGYQIGMVLPNSYNDQPSRSFAFTNLTLGIEVFKSKHILIDTRASYFLPLYEYNRNTRGIITTASFNFVF